MYLKRVYQDSEYGKEVVGVRVLKAGEFQKFWKRVAMAGALEGWLHLRGNSLIISGEDGDIEYQLVQTPGIYCCHCEKRLGDPGEGVGRLEKVKEFLAHVATHGAASPDPNNPAGYRDDDFFVGRNVTGVVDRASPEELQALYRTIKDGLRLKRGEKHQRPTE